MNADVYLWLKAGHIIAFVAWMAGLFYLPRLFVYHASAAVGSGRVKMLKIMERRLLKAIMTPAMVVTWLFGLSLVWVVGYLETGIPVWLMLKFVLVLVLSAFHGLLARHVKDFAAERNHRSQGYYRLINEVPTVLLITIVVLVVVKPL